jgi:uncharacterized ferritin-like protein (DUF455 family)
MSALSLPHTIRTGAAGRPEPFFPRALACLLAAETDDKLDMTAQLSADWLAGNLACQDTGEPPQIIERPGRPEKPLLVPPHSVRRRSAGTREGHAALIHALAHIEFNAINLALDAAYRFRDLPLEYYRDWLQVAAEEAVHFRLLRDHLRTLGFDYGAFTAHDGLWEMAVKTAHDPLVRMALVPRLLEARGLDASPAIITKLTDIRDQAGVAILEIILHDEVGHVRIGNRWYHYLCAQRGVEPVATFRDLMATHRAPRPRPPFHYGARRAAGFSEEELRDLESEFARHPPRR